MHKLNQMKLKPGLGASYTIRRGNGVVLLYSSRTHTGQTTIKITVVTIIAIIIIIIIIIIIVVIIIKIWLKLIRSDWTYIRQEFYKIC